MIGGRFTSIPDRLSSLNTTTTTSRKVQTLAPTTGQEKAGSSEDESPTSTSYPTVPTHASGLFSSSSSTASSPATTPPASETSHNKPVAAKERERPGNISTARNPLSHSFPLTPPPQSPLPPLPSSPSTSNQSSIPSKPTLQPKRRNSRSPSPINTDVVCSLPILREEDNHISGLEESYIAFISERFQQRPQREPNPALTASPSTDSMYSNKTTQQTTEGRRPQLQAPHRMRANQNHHQMGLAIGEPRNANQIGTEASNLPVGPMYSKFGSPFDETKPSDTPFGTYLSAAASPVTEDRLPSSTSAPNFSPGNGPLLLNNAEGGSRKRGPVSHLPYVSNNASTFNRYPTASPSPATDRGIAMTQHLEGVPSKGQFYSQTGNRQARMQSPAAHQRHRETEQAAMKSADDIVMEDHEGQSFYPVTDENGDDDEEEEDDNHNDEEEAEDYEDEDFDETEFAMFPGVPRRRQSAPNTNEYQLEARQDEVSDAASQADLFEPAWADDASCIDGSEHPAAVRRLMYQQQQQQQQQQQRGTPLHHREDRSRMLRAAKEVREELMPRAKSPEEETFEVAALRRQVEQLQMALKKQMVSSERPKGRGKAEPTTFSQGPSQLPPSSQMRMKSATGVRYPFGIPSPDASQNSSMVGASRIGSAKSGYRDYYSGDANYVDHYHTHQVPPGYHAMDQPSYYSDRREGAAAYYPNNTPAAAHINLHNDSDDFRRMGVTHSRQRVTSDPPTMSSILADESASAFVRDDTARMEEMARKIAALEQMFQNSSTISPPQSDTGSSQRQLDLQSQTGQSSSSSSARPFHSYQSAAQRTPSLSTISTRDGGTYGRSRSPAASAFNYNATPYARANGLPDSGDLSPVNPSGSLDNSSTSTVNRRKNGVARFIMGVGASRGNVPRDEHGNPLPTMQVSWSRKRTEKVAKPATGAKMKVGPGRGRIVMKAKPDVATSPTSQS